LKKVLFLIRSLNIGGAEKQLLTLVRGIDRTAIEPVIVTFYAEGELLPEFNRLKLRMYSAEKGGRWDIIHFVLKLIKIIQSEKPDIVVAYLVAANLLSIILKPFLQPSRLIISIRHSFIRQEDYDRMATILYWLEDKLARFSDRIIVNSYTGAKMANARGIPEEKMVVIPNGIDTDRFHPDANARRETRKAYHIPDTIDVIGIIGRLDPIKDHATFFKAASKVLEEKPDVKFMVVGSGEKQFESELGELTRSLGLDDQILWIPSQKDLLGIYNTLDFSVSSSVGEGFSNVISEAMACEVPCIATDVGDSGVIIGDSGIIISPGSPDEMAMAMKRMLQMPEAHRKQLGKLARERIIAQFSVKRMVNSTIQEFDRLVKN
jgi:glycosyltransferase involved in cell wall biosynthesis